MEACEEKVREATIKMSASSKVTEREFIVDWIRLYRELPALWKVNSEDYTNRQKKDVAYQILVSRYRKRYPDADREAVKKKLNSLRTNFRKELRKIAESVTLDPGNPYVSKLWYFKDMEFLRDQDDGKDYSIELVHSPTMLDPNPKTKRKWSVMEENSNPPPKEAPALEKDEYERLAQVWVTELQQMDRTQQLFAKKAINDIMFEGQMGTLRRNSVVINGAKSTSNYLS